MFGLRKNIIRQFLIIKAFINNVYWKIILYKYMTILSFLNNYLRPLEIVNKYMRLYTYELLFSKRVVAEF
jgi:hypothetical protein